MNTKNKHKPAPQTMKKPDLKKLSQNLPRKRLRPIKDKYTAVYFTDVEGQWRWGIFHSNRNEVACSGEGYKRIGSAQKSLRNLANWLKTNDIIQHEIRVKNPI